MILNTVVTFLKQAIEKVYTEHSHAINNKTPQFCVVELDLMDTDENCEMWLCNVFVYSNKDLDNAMKKHYVLLNKIKTLCKIKGVVVNGNAMTNFYQPQINAANIDGYYVHVFAIPIHRYESEE